jgi:subtilisin-like proprotein convertase family protein
VDEDENPQADIWFALTRVPPLATSIGVNLTASPMSVPLGGNTVLTGTVTAANGTANDVFVHIPRVPGLAFQTVQAEGGTCDLINQQISCSLGTIAAGASKAIHAVATGIYAAATRTATAAVTSSSADTTPTNNSDPVAVTVTTRPTVTRIFSTGNTAIPIQDRRSVGIPLDVPVTGTAVQIAVGVRINHANDSDLSLDLEPPDFSFDRENPIQLSARNGGTGDNYGSGANSCAGTETVFLDTGPVFISRGTAPFAGTFRPQTHLAQRLGKPIQGRWVLVVSDWEANGIEGTLGCAEIAITYVP